MPYSTGLSTPLSNFEAGQNYKDVSDPWVAVTFPLLDDAEGACLVAWTTTPWTLPSNMALCVHPELEYVRARDPATGRVYIVAAARLSELPGAVPEPKKKKAGAAGFEILKRFPGRELAGAAYEPLFPYFAPLRASGAFVVTTDAYVTSDSGTGVVHQAPAFGEDDYRVCLAAGVIAKGEGLPCPVDDAGRFTSEVADFAGQYVKDADRGIIRHLKEAGRLVSQGQLVHSYPFCWRSDTPLLYRAVPSWFVRVEEIKPRLLANNAKTRWVPSFVQEKRFHNWLENARDWAISRSRFWGTPLPIWTNEDFSETVVVGSIEELERLTGATAPVTDLHRHFIDALTVPAPSGNGVLRRVDDVFDCWFESGSMPYAQQHYPFERKDVFAASFPADFVSEGLDQTRGWFYTLMVLSTALFDAPAFKNLVCSGLVLAADGKKMSKRLKNYPDPMEVVHRHGADALRLYLINSPVVRAETLKFREEGVFGVVKDVFLPWYNAYRFLVQNVRRWEAEQGVAFDVEAHKESEDAGAEADADASSTPTSTDPLFNVLDAWILAATRSLTAFVRQEMEAYRLYTVVPRLVRFIDDLTNVYVRLNRRRLKGRGGAADASRALSVLFRVLLSVCSVMAPFTPFFTEAMYRNLRRALGPDAPASIHLRDLPPAEPARPGDERIQASVARMTAVIELARQVRDRHARGVKTPVASLVVVHPDAAFLDDIGSALREYVAEECNALDVATCADPLRYCTLSAAPEWQALGRRLGKRMGAVAAAVAKLSQEQVLAYERDGRVEVAGEVLGAGDLRIVRAFNAGAGEAGSELDAAGDGELLVVVDLSTDERILAAGLAREVVNRVQRLRKKAGLQVGQPVDAVLEVPEGPGARALLDAVELQRAGIADVLGRELRVERAAPADGADRLLAREGQTLRVGEDEVAFDLALLTLA